MSNPQSAAARHAERAFFGWRVVGAAFVLASFGWGIGFYGPPIFLQTLHAAHGWPVGLLSAAITAHYLCGAITVARLPVLYRQFGIPAVTISGTVALSVGILGWANASQPWQVFAAAMLSGGGWVTMSAAAVNAIVSPWFVRTRPAALAMAYNGSSVGGVIFAPLWVALIGWQGFPLAAGTVGAVSIAVVGALSLVYFAVTPQAMGQQPDGDAPGLPASIVARAPVRPLPGGMLWQDRRFLTLSAGMALGLFAQIGLLSHLYSLLVPPLGERVAGFAIAGATAGAIVGRTCLGWWMPAGADRRYAACVFYALQILGGALLIGAHGSSAALLLAGTMLFGLGIGNATSLPPLIAQAEFTRDDAARAVPMVIATAQAAYAFAPASFGLVRESALAGNGVFAAAMLAQLAAIAAFLYGRRQGQRAA